jgi:hypothetical protein
MSDALFRLCFAAALVIGLHAEGQAQPPAAPLCASIAKHVDFAEAPTLAILYS